MTFGSDSSRALHSNDIGFIRQRYRQVGDSIVRGPFDNNFDRAALSTAEAIANHITGNNHLSVRLKNSVIYLAKLHTVGEREQATQAEGDHEKNRHRATHHKRCEP